MGDERGDPEVRIGETRTLSDGFWRLDRVAVRRRGADGGEQEQQREVYRSGAGVAVLPFDPVRRTVLLVRQLRVPALVNGDPPFLVEACAGLVEGNDDPAATAAREAAEELGVRLRGLRELFDLYTSPGTCTERMKLFAAEYGEADRVGAGGGLPDEGEEVAVLELPLAEASAMARDGRIVDAKTVLLLLALEARAGAAAGATVGE